MAAKLVIISFPAKQNPLNYANFAVLEHSPTLEACVIKDIFGTHAKFVKGVIVKDCSHAGEQACTDDVLDV